MSLKYVSHANILSLGEQFSCGLRIRGHGTIYGYLYISEAAVESKVNTTSTSLELNVLR